MTFSKTYGGRAEGSDSLGMLCEGIAAPIALQFRRRRALSGNSSLFENSFCAKGFAFLCEPPMPAIS